MVLQAVGPEFLAFPPSHTWYTVPVINGHNWHFWLHPIQHIWHRIHFSQVC